MNAKRIDVRREPLVVRDGCAPDRIPAGRWPADEALVRSEQFAVNEAIACLASGGYSDHGNDGAGYEAGSHEDGSHEDGEQHAVFGVHAPEGTGVTAVFGDLVAAIVTERARRIAELPDPTAAFGQTRMLDGFVVTEPVRELTGYEIVLTAPEAGAGQGRLGLGLPPIGAGWRDRATRADYFASTARLADGVGAWAMLAARLGDPSTNRAFAERWWRGAMRGTDVLFPAGDSMATALAQVKDTAVYWPACVAWFRASLAKVQKLAAERMEVSRALSRLSELEEAWEEASGAVEVAEARLTLLSGRESAVRDAVTLADEDYRARLAALGALELSRPEMATVTPLGLAALRSRGAVGVALAGGVRRGRNWRGWSVTRRQLRAVCAAAERAWDTALRESESLRTDVAAARTAVADATAEVSRLAVAMEPLATMVAAARQRWGDHVPVGPSQAETEDPALIEWRETSAPWADPEYANARADVFIAAIELHKALIAARAEVFQANLEALMHLLSVGGQVAHLPAQHLGNAWGTGAGTSDDLFGGARPSAPGSQPTGLGAVGSTLGGYRPADGNPVDAGLADTGLTDDGLADAGLADAGVADTGVAEFILAAWRSFFLVVPVVQVPFDEARNMFAGPEGAPLGWLLAGQADKLTADEVPALLRRFSRAVFAGDTVLAEEAAVAESAVRAEDAAAAEERLPAESRMPAGRTALAQASGLPPGSALSAGSGLPPGSGVPGSGVPGEHRVVAQTARVGGTSVPPQRTAQHLADQLVRYGTWLPAGPSGAVDGTEARWVGMPLRVVRGQDRTTVNHRNDLAYDGLLITNRD